MALKKSVYDLERKEILRDKRKVIESLVKLNHAKSVVLEQLSQIDNKRQDCFIDLAILKTLEHFPKNRKKRLPKDKK